MRFGKGPKKHHWICEHAHTSYLIPPCSSKAHMTHLTLWLEHHMYLLPPKHCPLKMLSSLGYAAWWKRVNISDKEGPPMDSVCQQKTRQKLGDHYISDSSLLNQKQKHFLANFAMEPFKLTTFTWGWSNWANWERLSKFPDNFGAPAETKIIIDSFIQ